jgi:hypothetical protein
MVSIAQLWLPIIVSAVGVFIASSLIHMVFKWHNSDYLKLANEDAVRAAIRAGNAGVGQYVMPHCTDHKDFRKPEMQQKFVEGPNGFIVLRPTGLPGMGRSLGLWFALTLAIAFIVAAVAHAALTPQSSSMQVFHLTAIVTLLAYGGGSVQNGIWMGKTWGSVLKDLLDALIFGAITGCAFTCLWPHAA